MPDPKNQKTLQRDPKALSDAAAAVKATSHPVAGPAPIDAAPPWAKLPETPADAPKTVVFPAQLEKQWAKLWDDTYTEHDNAVKADSRNAEPLTETGATVEVGIFGGEPVDTAVGGVLRTPSEFGARWWPDPGYLTTGVFHLHDYPSKSTSASVDGQDAKSMVGRGDSFVVARSGTAKDGVNEYMFVRTKATKDLPPDPQGETQSYTDDFQTKNGKSFNEATRQEARDFAKKYNLVYYEGSNGKFKRVYPP